MRGLDTQGRSVATLDVSIVIVNWNTRDLLKQCLQSVFAETRDVSFEIIVVDNASTDGSQSMIRAEFPQITLVENSINRGFAAANNEGFCEAHGRYVLLLNSDTLIQKGAIQHCVRRLDARHNIGVLGCRVTYPDGRHQGSYFRFPDLLSTAILTFHVHRLLPRGRLNYFRYFGRRFTEEHPVDVVAGCFFMIRRETLDQVGGLDESFFIYGEEAEWCWRIARAGWSIVYWPHATIVHVYGGSSQTKSLATRLAKRRGGLLFFEKTKGRAWAWAANFLLAVGALTFLPATVIWALVARVGGHRMPVWHDSFRIVSFHLVGLVRPVWCQSERWEASVSSVSSAICSAKVSS